MSRSSAPALRGTLLRSLLRRWNPIMRWLLESRRGRKTGRRYSTPVSYVREGDTSYVTTGDRWWRNLIGGAPVAIRITGRWHQGHAVVLTDPEQSKVEHQRLFREHPWFRVLAGIPRGKGGGPDRDAVDRSVAAGRVLVRIEGLKRSS